MLVKSSAESIELAFDTAEYCCKKLFKSEEGGRYNKWYCYGVEFGQDYAWFKVEHTDYSVRLSFEFMDTGFVYVDGYFTNGSSYDKKTITSWRFDSESEDVAADKVKDVLDRFFDEGINVLRGEEVMNSRRPIKSGTSIKEYAGFKIDDSVKINSPKRGPYKNGKTGIVVGFYKSYDGEILISVQLDEGGLMDFSKDELENLGDSGYHITYLDSSRRPIKSGLQDGEVIFRASTRGGKNTVEVIDTGDSVDRYAIKQDGSMDYADTTKGVLAKLLKQAGWKEDTFSKVDVDTANIGRDYLQIVKMINDEFGFLYKSPKGSRERQFYFDIVRFIAQNIERGSDMAIEDMIWKAKDALRAKGINSSRRPIKSSIDNIEEHGIYHNDTWQLEVVKLVGNTALLRPVKDDSYFCVKNPEIDEQGDLVWTSDTLPMTDYDTALKEFNYHKDLNNTSPTFNSRRPIKSSDTDRTYEEYKGNLFDLEEHGKWFDDNKLNREIAGYFGKDKVQEFYDIVGNAKLDFDGWRIYIRYPDIGLEYYIKSGNGRYELHSINHQGMDFTIGSSGHWRDVSWFFSILRDKLPNSIESSRRPVKSSRKPIKSANYNGFNLEARRSYGKGNGYFTTYPVWDTDLDTSIGAIEYHYDVENPYYVAWVYDDFGVNKTGRTKAFDTEEECLEWIGEELASGTTARDKLLKYWEELGYDYKSKNLNNSRKPVKSSFIVGKQDNGTKVYFCEDGQYYSENDYTRPSIKIFNSKQEADKIAKRSKNGFVSPLEK